jgi:hypothetical protein
VSDQSRFDDSTRMQRLHATCHAIVDGTNDNTLLERWTMAADLIFRREREGRVLKRDSQ